MLLSLLLFLSAPSFATTPIPFQAEQANATAATRLAAEAHARASKALRLASSKSNKAHEAELGDIKARMAYLMNHSAKADRKINEIRAALGRLDEIERRLRKVEARQVGLVLGIGGSLRMGPPIAEVYYGVLVPYLTAEIGFVSEDGRSGWTLMGEGHYNPKLHSPGGGGYAAVYAKNPWGLKRFALGGYAGGQFTAYGQEADYNGYKATGEAGLYLRGTIDRPRDGFGVYAVGRIGGYYGQAADFTGNTAAEFGGVFTLTVEVGKFWR